MDIRPLLLRLTASAILMNGANPRDAAHARTAARSSTTDAGETTQPEIAQAMSAGPIDVAKSAKIVDTDAHGKVVVLREGNNGFTCMPGDPRAVGDPPMCADAAAMQWSADFKAHKAKPTNTEPGIIYMLAGATQRSDTDPYVPTDLMPSQPAESRAVESNHPDLSAMDSSAPRPTSLFFGTFCRHTSKVGAVCLAKNI
jgi:hypothetical protein